MSEFVLINLLFKERCKSVIDIHILKLQMNIVLKAACLLGKIRDQAIENL